MHKHIGIFSSVCCLTLTVFSFDCAAEGLTVKNGWVRMPPPVSDSAAAYLELHNETSADVYLTAITSDDADMVMLHQTQHDQHLTSMVEISNMLIPANSDVNLLPGKHHIMLSGLHRTFSANEQIFIQLHFSDGSTQQAMLEVRDPRIQTSVDDSGTLKVRDVTSTLPAMHDHMQHMHMGDSR
ncbi:MAG: hypothetical protein CO186_12130 [Zetaproteobacteria bacterium CG_4_9_14_3_um_filter_49_83]|nr:MAG: hypothetical protein AUJ56_10535 [Zetaproteobacteria bacterium CG1_02_49_23]PIQ34458.1 MAG: hypothetical protein COW62_01990 [Zetaproteobacteria bacterium CG17_big_fil_post_rev_8_21_14_2_50_50_13]PIV29067.1 MAG: hypothetical protein COS35_14140 [Zetaproteobacteria bacterium CG02_land_8_20_14_3_00_50_9]PIY56441.1 MAG: hypothetical protein COZ00_04490 [Zetaproteobacteria bacterium CG_4_10_14_0_8_um_filter_49_80]PJA34080.1 MAG: hypothetical protein CO186_12130 [Zetaproteobacteria bacterium